MPLSKRFIVGRFPIVSMGIGGLALGFGLALIQPSFSTVGEELPIGVLRAEQVDDNTCHITHLIYDITIWMEGNCNERFQTP